MKLLRLHLVGLGLVFGLLAACSSTSGPEAFAEHFYTTVAEGEVEQVVELFSYKDMEKAKLTAARGKVAMMVGMMQMQVNAAGGIEKIEIVKVTQADDNHAQVNSILHMGDGSSDQDSLKLVRVDGEWKVSIF